jgi:hypothetical protein
VAVQYDTVAAAYRDLEQVSSRLALIDRLAELLRQTPDRLLPRVVCLCLGDIAPAFTGIETGDLGLTAEELLAAHGAGRRVSTLEVGVVDLYRTARPTPAGT